MARYAPIIPNALTLLRLVIAVWFPLAPSAWRLTLVIVGGVSDGLDGLFARKLHAQTWIGAILDAVADKAFTLTVLMTLTYDGPLVEWQLWVILSRDLVVLFVAVYAGLLGRWSLFKRVSARLPGKAATVAIFGTMVGVLAWPAASTVLIALAAATSAIAAADYLAFFLRNLALFRPDDGA